MRNVVVKWGGASLFDDDTHHDAILRTVQPGDAERTFVLIGGGDTIESMRTLHALYPSLDTVAMHWRCIRLLDATWEVACELMPQAIPIPDWDTLLEVGRCGDEGVYMVRTAAFYSESTWNRIPSAWLPRIGWETTTDALSWLLAKLIGATHLRIVKNCVCDPHLSLQDASEQGLVDSELVRLVEQDPERNQLVVELLQREKGKSL